jgi:hypothetical protein
MAVLKITRSSEYVNRLRKIKLLIDDKEAGIITDGETKAFDVPGVFTRCRQRLIDAPVLK